MKRGLRLHHQDNCIVMLDDVLHGDAVAYDGGSVIANADVDLGHKLSIEAIAIGGKIRKYGASIGSATAAIAPGDHIHTHNLKSDYIVGFHH